MIDEFRGYDPELEDLQSLADNHREFRYAVDGMFSAPEEIDPRKWHRIENQSSMGSCQGHALSSVGEMAFIIAIGEVIQFSPMWCYLNTQKIDGLLGSDRGSTISGGAKCAKTVGFVPEEMFPYPRPARYHSNIPDELYPEAAKFRIQSHSILTSYEDVFQYLASGQGGVEIGISWGLQPNREGVVERFNSGGGGHAVSFLGYSTRKDSQGRNYLWLANSWDTSWGRGGWAEVSPRAVDEMSRHRYTVMIGMSDLTTPEPRPVDWIGDSIFN